jgi:hypothetical protein
MGYAFKTPGLKSVTAPSGNFVRADSTRLELFVGVDVTVFGFIRSGILAGRLCGRGALLGALRFGWGGLFADLPQDLRARRFRIAGISYHCNQLFVLKRFQVVCAGFTGLAGIA